MKIVHVTHYYLPHVGGIEFYVHRLARDQRAAGHDVRVISSDLSGVPAGEHEIDGVPVTYLRARTVLPRNPYLRGLSYALRHARPDIVHIHSMWFIPSAQAIRAVSGSDVRVVNTVHGVTPDDAGFVVRTFLRIFRPVARYILRRSDVVIALADSERCKLDAFPAPRGSIEVIGNGVDAVPATGSDTEAALAAHGRYLLFSGRIIADKNPDLAINAFARLAQRDPSLRLVMMGPVEDDYRKALVTQLDADIAERVIFLGALDPLSDRERMAGLYAGALGSICVGSWEGLPTRLLESLVVGTPVVAFRSGGTASVLRDGKNGWLLDELTVDALTPLLERMVAASDHDRATMAAACRESVTPWEWSTTVERVLDTYASGVNA